LTSRRSSNNGAASEKARMLRCASALVIAAYANGTPHSSGIARLACGAFCEAAN
jgi:hypothetical protein